MSTLAVNIVIEQGEDFDSTFKILNPDNSIPSLTSYTVESNLKKHPGATTSYNLNPTIDTTLGIATVSLGSSVTKNLDPGRYYYDLFLISPAGKRTKRFEGNATVNGSATLPS